MYKHLLRKKKKQHVNCIVNRIMSASRNDPKVYWNALKSLQNVKKDSKASQIPLNEWYNHFKSCNNDDTLSTQDADMLTRLEELEKNSVSTFCELDFRITMDELHKTIKQLRNNKATGLDSISNEMIKNCNNSLSSAILKLLNFILSTSIYPDDWSKGIISTIFKGGDQSICSNYRGITISSCLGKLLATILNQRLLKYVGKHDLIPENQIGFLPNHRTSDHAFILKSAIDKYMSQKNRSLYVCFVDFRRAFDSVWQRALLYKLQQLGINGLFYKIIKQMYASNQVCVRGENGLSPFFPSTVGVRQGCALSPLLFNLYVSDLSKILNSTANQENGITLFNKSLTHLFYADDLVILSDSPAGLQNSLNLIHEYCKEWRLSINISKTKVMIFSRSHRKSAIKNFTPKIGGISIEVVNEYKYLGIIFSSNNSCLPAKNHLEKRAKKALYGMHSYINNCQLPVGTCTNLYDRLISPIALFGSELWAPFCLNLKAINNANFSIFNKYTDFPGMQMQLKFDKRILQVHEKSVNLAVLGELGHSPSMISVLYNIVNFWVHIIQSPENGLLYDAYLCSYDQFFRNNSSNKWFQVIRLLCDNYPVLKTFWDNQRIHNSSSPHRILKVFKNAMCADFKLFWRDEIDRFVSNNPTGGGRLGLFSRIKKEFNLETYLSEIKNNSHRKLFSQMRISAHKLRIEAGRHCNTPRNERFCLFCDDEAVEDECHFILGCKKFETERKTYLEKMSTLYPSFSCLSKDDKLIFLLGNSETAPLTAAFLYDIYNKRTAR